MLDSYFENDRSSSPTRNNFDINAYFLRTATRSRSLQKDRMREEMIPLSHRKPNQLNHSFCKTSHLAPASISTHNTPRASTKHAVGTCGSLPKVVKTPKLSTAENSLFIKRSPFCSESENSPSTCSSLRSEIERKLRPISVISTTERSDRSSPLIYPTKPSVPKSSQTKSIFTDARETRPKSASRMMLIPQIVTHDEKRRSKDSSFASPQNVQSALARKEETKQSRYRSLERNIASKKTLNFGPFELVPKFQI